MNPAPQVTPAARIFVAVEEAGLRALLLGRLREAGYAPEELTPDELLTREPGFCARRAAVVFLYAGPDPERMHAIAQRLYRDWSEQGLVLLFAIHPESATEQDTFRLWQLDALWGYDAKQQLVTLSRSIRQDWPAMADELVSAVPMFLGRWKPDTSTENEP